MTLIINEMCSTSFFPETHFAYLRSGNCFFHFYYVLVEMISWYKTFSCNQLVFVVHLSSCFRTKEINQYQQKK